jgi:hypothetical protein
MSHWFIHHVGNLVGPCVFCHGPLNEMRDQWSQDVAPRCATLGYTPVVDHHSYQLKVLGFPIWSLILPSRVLLRRAPCSCCRTISGDEGPALAQGPLILWGEEWMSRCPKYQLVNS